MDFLDTIVRRNPSLIQTAVSMHQRNELPANSVVVDLDMVEENAVKILDAAAGRGIHLYFMTKQFGRNPEICRTLNNVGIDKAVAVDLEDGICLQKNGIRVGHIGHLVQIPKASIRYVLSSMAPEVITVFSYEKALQISEVAKDLGIVQNLLIRVVGKGDFFYPFQFGGIEEEDLLETVGKICELPSVKVVGVVSFPCFRFDVKARKTMPMPNLFTLKRTAETLEKELGLRITQINAPGDSSAQMMDQFRELGVTHVEPGNAFTGTTPWHAFEDLPEKPAWLYLSEISHVNGDNAYAIGGGLMSGDSPMGIWSTLYHNHRLNALSGDNVDSILRRKILAERSGYIDYYGTLYGNREVEFSVGDSVIYGLRNQVFVSRANVAIVKGIQSHKPVLLGIFDRLGNPIETSFFGR
ncbi:alanine racemase [Mesotoga sp.]|uniref:alanine racemase n=1 Tax=Mesotoga sp. TaxID=2053577 RepID=UPI002593FA40|nr:alanine racemase [Mesotoga sp.]MDD3680989.1 alanine racemase [Mesotoga sp.]MDD4207727.1 alanine racemase [Mesotoga sp.]MDD4825429.1 alanine racemase [Mesotoga sp.]